MAKDKTLGFFTFHITAEKTMGYLQKNGFKLEDLTIIPVSVGEKFGETADTSEQPEIDNAAKQLNHHTIIDFFKHLFHYESKQFGSIIPYISDREGFILAVLTSDAEQKQIAEESMDSHGAYFIKEM